MNKEKSIYKNDHKKSRKPIFKNNLTQYVLGICMFVFLGSCNQENNVANVERRFYYWKSNASNGYFPYQEVNYLNVKKIYYKFFEVDYSETMGNYPIEKKRPKFILFKRT